MTNEPNQPDHKKTSFKSMAVLAGLLMVCILGGSAISLVTSDNIGGWYAELVRPSWTPPNWVFGPVWSLLYTLMAVAMWLVWRRGGQSWANVRPAAVWFAIQLGLNFLWTPVFFEWHLLDWAIVVIVLLDAAVVITIVVFARYSRLAAGLMVPYLLWCLYATSLSIGFWWLNRGAA